MRHCNNPTEPGSLWKHFTFEAMLAEVLDLTTDALGAPFLNDPTAAPGEIFSYKAMFGEGA